MHQEADTYAGISPVMTRRPEVVMHARVGLIRSLDSVDDPLFPQVMELGDSRRDRVGFLPRAAFEAYAEDSTIIVMEHQGQAVGYACYALPGLRVRLIHLCVKPGFEGKGIARALVEQISSRHHERQGISVKCRPYPHIDKVWRALGFTAVGQVVGRGHERAKLTCWWRDHGHPTLFTPQSFIAEREPVLRVVIDVNIFCDLFVDGARSGAERSRVLQADHIAGQIEIFVTNELKRELSSIEDRGDRQRLQGHLQSSGLSTVAVDPATVERNYLTLLDRIRQDCIARPITESDQADLRHVAEVAASDTSVLVTRDESLIRRVGPAAAEYLGVHIAAPEHVLIRLDELANAQHYRPQRLYGTGYEVVRSGSTSENAILSFRNSPLGESDRELRDRVRDLQRKSVPIWVIRDPGGAPVAAYAWDARDAILEVPLMRIAATPLAETLCMQLLFMLREHCRRSGHTVLRVTDPKLSGLVRRVAEFDGFRFTNKDLCCLVIHECGPASVVELTLAAAAAEAGITEHLPVLPRLPGERAAELERLFWPLKITDSALTTWIVPILPTWSSRLFNSPESLELRADKLGISREHVYYNSGRVVSVHRPGSCGIAVATSMEVDKSSLVRGSCRCCTANPMLCTGVSVTWAYLGSTTYARSRLAQARSRHSGSPIPSSSRSQSRSTLTARLVATAAKPSSALGGSQERSLRISTDEHTGSRRHATPLISWRRSVTAARVTCVPPATSGGAVRVSVIPRSLLLSLHPRFAHAILQGRKTVELRRQRVGASPGAAVILYATSPVMAVLGTAQLDSVDIGDPQSIWQRHGNRTALAEHEFHEYFTECDIASALVLRQPTWLPAPMELSALQAVSAFRPPQSYRYVGLNDPAVLRQLGLDLYDRHPSNELQRLCR